MDPRQRSGCGTSTTSREDTTMITDRTALQQLLEKGSDADLLREMIGFVAERVMGRSRWRASASRLGRTEGSRTTELLSALLGGALAGVAIVGGLGALVDRSISAADAVGRTADRSDRGRGAAGAASSAPSYSKGRSLPAKDGTLESSIGRCGSAA
jgi:hypothetical protein